MMRTPPPIPIYIAFSERTFANEPLPRELGSTAAVPDPVEEYVPLPVDDKDAEFIPENVDEPLLEAEFNPE
jgi:hypothetical protein